MGLRRSVSGSNDLPSAADLSLVNYANCPPIWWLLIGINSGCALGPSFISLLRGRLDLFNCRHIFLVFIWLQVCLWPAWVLIAGLDSFDSIKITFTSENSQFTTGVMFLSTGALLAFHMGYYGVPKTLVSAVRSSLASLDSLLTPATMKLVQPFYICIGLASSAIFFQLAGGLHYLQNIDEFRVNNLTGLGPVFLGLGFLGVAFFLSYYRATVARTRPRILTIVAGLVGTLACVLSLLCGFRHMFLLVIATALIVHHYMVKRIKMSVSLLIVVCAFILFNFLYIEFRSTGNFPDVDNIPAAAWRGFFKRFVGLESLVRVRAVVNNDNRLGPIPLLQEGAYSLIPRSFLPDKPPVLGWTANLLFYPDAFTRGDAGSVPLGVLGDLFWQGGTPAVLIGCGVLGVLSCFVNQLILVRRVSPLALLLYVNLYVFFMFVAEDLKLHFIYTFHRLFFMISPLIILTLFVRPFCRKRLALLPAPRSGFAP